MRPASSTEARVQLAAAGESEPDARFSLAGERTFLAWNRTALALVGAGIAVTQLLPRASAPAPLLIGLPLIVVGVILATASLGQFSRTARALRRGQPLPSSPLPMLLAATVAWTGVAAVVLIALGKL